MDILLNGQIVGHISQDYWFFLSGLAGILLGAGFLFALWRAIL